MNERTYVRMYLCNQKSWRLGIGELLTWETERCWSLSLSLYTLHDIGILVAKFHHCCTHYCIMLQYYPNKIPVTVGAKKASICLGFFSWILVHFSASWSHSQIIHDLNLAKRLSESEASAVFNFGDRPWWVGETPVVKGYNEFHKVYTP